MSDHEEPHHIPAPAITGFLEIAEHAVLGGMDITDRIRGNLDLIEDHESYIASQQEDHRVEPEHQPRIDSAYYHLGKIAALNALLDRPERHKLGF